MRFLLTLIVLPILAVAAGIGLVLGERELMPSGQAAAVGTEITLDGRAYAPIEVIDNQGGAPLLLEAPLEVTVAQIVRPDAVVLKDLTTGQSGKRVIRVSVPDTLPNAVLLVPLEGVATAADISLTTQSVLDPGPLKDLGFGYLSAAEVQRAAGAAAVTLAALIVLWLPGWLGRGMMRRKLRKVLEDIEEERVKASRAQKEAKAAAARADERVKEIEANAAAREEEARTAIANAARLEAQGSGGDEGGEAGFWREAVKDFLLAGNVGREDVERMLKAISERVKGVEEAPAVEQPVEDAAPESIEEEVMPEAVEAAPEESADEKGDQTGGDEPKKGILGRRRRRR